MSAVHLPLGFTHADRDPDGGARECVSDDAGESVTGNDFNGDLLTWVGTSTLFRWKNTNYTTLAAPRTATGFELAGRVYAVRAVSGGVALARLVTRIR
jgi:hypothetical protein